MIAHTANATLAPELKDLPDAFPIFPHGQNLPGGRLLTSERLLDIAKTSDYMYKNFNQTASTFCSWVVPEEEGDDQPIRCVKLVNAQVSTITLDILDKKFEEEGRDSERWF
jgi:hypothetical protein